MNASRTLARVFVAVLAAATVIGTGSPAQAQRISIKDLLARIVALETENTQLKAQVEELKQRDVPVFVDANDVVVGRSVNEKIALVDVDGQLVPLVVSNAAGGRLLGTSGTMRFADSTCTGQPYINTASLREEFGVVLTPFSFVDVAGDGMLYLPDPNAAEERLVLEWGKASFSEGCLFLGARADGFLVTPAISTGSIPIDEFTPPFRIR